MGRINIVFVITGLNTAGAELMLYKLVSAMDRTSFSPEVISITDYGPVGKKIATLGVPVRAMGITRGRPDPRALQRLCRDFQQHRPDLVQTWLYHADLIGGLAARLAGGIPVTWGIRNGNLDPKGSKRSTIWTAKACARLSTRLPRRIICCSEASRRIHAGMGYCAEKMVVIPNGFDLSEFSPSPGARLLVRQELKLPENTRIVGLVGRYDPQKDHENFIKAAGYLIKTQPDTHFLLCGDHVTWENRELAGRIDSARLRLKFSLLGKRDDIQRLTAAFDVAVSASSYGEAFPNVIGEAMACGVPCVVTNVGDSAIIVGETGRVVPPRNPEALAEALREFILMEPAERAGLGVSARQRVLTNYNLPDIVAQYESLYKEIITG